MSSNLNQRRIEPSILTDPSPSSTVTCLQGLEGLKPQLFSQSQEERMAVLSQALKCGPRGKDWIFQIVKHETGPVQWAAYDLLWDSASERVRQKLLHYCPLPSDVGVDYSRLRDLLAAGQWREAEGETKKVMLEAAGRQQEGMLDRESSEKFPIGDLHTIDQLWVTFSQGRFGFSVQKKIWQNIVATEQLETDEAGHRHFTEDFREQIARFGDRVGWRKGENWLNFRNLTFDLSAPKGHLPSPSFATPCNGNEGEEQAPWGKWCVAFCFGGIKCGVLFLGWWSLLEREDL
jgi:hypothetical protein